MFEIQEINLTDTEKHFFLTLSVDIGNRPQRYIPDYLKRSREVIERSTFCIRCKALGIGYTILIFPVENAHLQEKTIKRLVREFRESLKVDNTTTKVEESVKPAVLHSTTVESMWNDENVKDKSFKAEKEKILNIIKKKTHGDDVGLFHASYVPILREGSVIPDNTGRGVIAYTVDENVKDVLHSTK